MMRTASPQAPALLLAATALAYAAGLGGPFVLDDHVNLQPVWAWWSGHLRFAEIFSNPSGPLGRPLAMLSFAANAALGGPAPFGFKLFNLALHLAAALLALRVLQRIADTGPAGFGARAALLLAALWALHPQHVGSVLYVVQRMALLGALAQLGAVWLYLDARSRLARDPPGAARRLFLVLPLVVAAGLLAKETAALAPLLCLVVELTLFRGPRPRAVRLFFAVFLLVPLALGAALLALDPSRLLAGYDGREFDLAQRLLTQPRVLLDYAAGWFWPVPANLALYRDGYVHSTGPMQPASTALALLLLAAAASAAWIFRRRRPLLACGIGWFFAAHLLESSAWPLEPYFEHRNYVASLGLLLAAWGLLAPPAQRLPPRVAAVLAALLLATLAGLTAVRAWHWRDLDALLAHEGPPAGEVSRRLQVDRMIRAVERGDPSQREAALTVLERGNAGDRAAAALWRTVLACDLERRVAPALLQGLAQAPPDVLGHNHLSWLGLLVDRALARRCEGLAPAALDRLLQDWRQSARKPPTPSSVARIMTLQQRLRAHPDAAPQP